MWLKSRFQRKNIYLVSFYVIFNNPDKRRRKELICRSVIPDLAIAKIDQIVFICFVLTDD